MLLSIKVVRKSRSASKTLYLAYYLNVFFKLALRHIATFASLEFDFILATRQRN
jgi:hypothetical protein